MTGFRYVPDEAALRQLTQGDSGPVVRWLDDQARQITNVAKTEAPVDTGNLRARHEFAISVEGKEVVARIGSTADYAEAVHEGRQVNTTARHRGRTVSITGRTRGNNWLERTLNRFGLQLHRN